MTIPATHTSALALLLLSFLCLGCWANGVKLAGARWRFEFFYIDFSIGALLLAVLASFTLGSSGTDLGPGDQALVAGRMAQVWAIAGGVVFNIGNLLLIAAMSLAGMATAFPLAAAVALIITCAIGFHASNSLLLSLGIVCSLAAAVCAGRAGVARAPQPPAKRTPGRPAPIDPRRMRAVKGLIAGVFGGVFLGFCYQLAANGINGDFGLGPYAGLFLFTIGILGSTLLFSLLFTITAIEGAPIKLSSYFHGSLKQHILGLAGGAIWATGFLAALLARMTPPQSEISDSMRFAVPVASVLLYVVWGFVFWKETAPVRPSGKGLIAGSAVLLISAIALISNGLAR